MKVDSVEPMADAPWLKGPKSPKAQKPVRSQSAGSVRRWRPMNGGQGSFVREFDDGFGMVADPTPALLPSADKGHR
ncbi:hypothetical protein FQN55_003534 [Onygenales sp. PD_40]|nr:hypothetical protein FQN55_003534 [Onygenales sp. PD_40]KAK2785893.1 hypothetical protein FQN53_007269 [Emmonsiellopsis sp. PD_33]